MKNILLDTDIGPDCDDAAAVAMLNIYENLGLCRILGIAHCTSNPYGAGTVDAICRYYGHPDVPISTYSGKGFLDDEVCRRYNQYITRHMENRYRDTQPEDAVGMYRRILSRQPDKSVDFIAIGPMNNLSQLLNSGADEWSSVTGVELVRAKGKRLVSMAGIFSSPVEGLNAYAEEQMEKSIEEAAEFNVVCDIPAARNVAENWPTEKVFLGFEAGLLETGARLQTEAPEDHPVRTAYKLHNERGVRFSWDLLTTEFAIDDGCGHYTLSEAGKVRFDELGRTVFTPGAGTDRYVIWKENASKIAEDIDRLLVEERRIEK